MSYYYDWNIKASRYEHLEGQYDEVCKGFLNVREGAPCTVVNSADGKLKEDFATRFETDQQREDQPAQKL